VPVGAFLSAGIDSGALVGLMTELNLSQVQTITLAFDEFEGRSTDEASLAAKSAAAYGTQHSTRRISRQEFEADLPNIFEAMDQPSIDGVNTCSSPRPRPKKDSRLRSRDWAAMSCSPVTNRSPICRAGFAGCVCRRAFPAPAGCSARSQRRSHALRACLPNFRGCSVFGGSIAGAYLLKRGLFLPWELQPLLDPVMIREGLSRLSTLEWVKPPAEPGAIDACGTSRDSRSQRLHAQPIAEGCRLGGHGAFAGNPRPPR